MQFLYSSWLKTPLSTRQKIAQDFGIIKRGSTEVFNNEVVRDGYVIGEIEAALNADALQAYTQSTSTDLTELWEAMIAKAEGKEVVIVADQKAPYGYKADGVPRLRPAPTWLRKK